MMVRPVLASVGLFRNPRLSIQVTAVPRVSPSGGSWRQVGIWAVLSRARTTGAGWSGIAYPWAEPSPVGVSVPPVVECWTWLVRLPSASKDQLLQYALEVPRLSPTVDEFDDDGVAAQESVAVHAIDRRSSWS